MIVNFRSQKAQDIYDGVVSRQARKIPRTVWPVVQRKLDMLNAARHVGDLKSPPGNKLEALTGDRKGFYSIRVNQKYRIAFRFENANAFDVDIVDYH